MHDISPKTTQDILLELKNLCVNYGGIQALQNINLTINAGEVVSLIGANGAGKSTTLRAISKIVKLHQGQIIYNGRDITRRQAHEVVKLGIAHSPEGRRVLAQQTVLANLELGAYVRSNFAKIKADLQSWAYVRSNFGKIKADLKSGAYVRSNSAAIKADLDYQFKLFPRLAERRSQLAGTLSGGEQQMLAIARALMSRPKLLLLDEPSLGLAPAIVKEIFAIIQHLRSTGVTILLVEQNASLALQIADRAYVLEAGNMTLTGPASDLLNDDRVKRAYLG